MRRIVSLCICLICGCILSACTQSAMTVPFEQTQEQKINYEAESTWKTSDVNGAILGYIDKIYGLCDLVVTGAYRSDIGDGEYEYEFHLSDKDTNEEFIFRFIKFGPSLTAFDDFDTFDPAFISITKHRTVLRLDHPLNRVETRTVNCETEYATTTTVLKQNHQDYEIEYTSVSKDRTFPSYDMGPISGEMEESTYRRILDAIDYISENEDEFNKKAAKFSQLTYANPNADTLFDAMLSWFAIYVNADDESTDGAKQARYEAYTHLEDIEQIIDHPYFENSYVYENIYTHRHEFSDGRKSGLNEDGVYCIADYYSSKDENLRIVDYDTYVNTWNFYTNNSDLYFDDKDMDYAILADMAWSGIVSVHVEALSIDNGSLNATIYRDGYGATGDGNGAILIIPVPKGTVLGDIEYTHSLYENNEN